MIRHPVTLKVAVALGVIALCGTETLAAPRPVPTDDFPVFGEPGGPVRELTVPELRVWLRGRKLFDKDFHGVDGVGTPEMNADSCRGCHQDPVLGGAGGLELNVSRFGYDNGGQGPFQNVDGGQALSKLRPPWEEGREDYDPATADVFEQRQTPTVLGIGLIDAITDVEIMSHEDPNDSNADGIFGVARMIDVGGRALEVGRFGWKAQVPHISDFIRDAMGGENGITTPDDGRGFALTVDADGVADPELTQTEIDELEFFLQMLAPPLRKGGENDPEVIEGEGLFADIGCIDCHMILEGPDGLVPLYSNLLLHNVAEPGYRGMAEPGAPSGFFRTPPLWGIVDTPPYLHDGRAETLLDAIREHYGEAEEVKNNFFDLTLGQRDAVLAFLADL